MLRSIWWKVRAYTGKGRAVLGTVAEVITVLGIVTFTNFIFEEAIQTTMFGTRAAKDAKDWPLVWRGMQVIEGINFHMKCVNNGLGWLHPLAFMMGKMGDAQKTPG